MTTKRDRTEGDQPDVETTEANLRIWNARKEPPPSSLKQIRGGRLKGMTDINPQYRYESLTALFGPCGTGWWFEVVNTEQHQCGTEIMLSATVHLSYEGCTHPIVGNGGSMLYVQEKGGLRLNDEAVKMAVTDALSVCCKMLGIASAIYEGLWDGSKYRDDDEREHQRPQAPHTRTPVPPAGQDALQQPAQANSMDIAKVDYIKKVAMDMAMGDDYKALEILKDWSSFTGKSGRTMMIETWEALREKAASSPKWVGKVYGKAKDAADQLEQGQEGANGNIVPDEQYGDTDDLPF